MYHKKKLDDFNDNVCCLLESLNKFKEIKKKGKETYKISVLSLYWKKKLAFLRSYFVFIYFAFNFFF